MHSSVKHRRSAPSVLMAFTILGIVTGGCGGSDPPTGPRSGTVEVTLQADAFSPSQVTLEAGATVRWVNGGDVVHTITPDGHGEWTRAVLESDGEFFEHTFHEPGDYPYLCEPHQALGMVGTIRVVP